MDELDWLRLRDELLKEHALQGKCEPVYHLLRSLAKVAENMAGHKREDERYKRKVRP